MRETALRMSRLVMVIFLVPGVCINHFQPLVKHESMNLLDTRRILRGDDDFMITAAFGFSSVLSREQHGDNADFFCCLEGADDIGAIAAGGEAYEDIAGFGESLDAAGENMFVDVVVTNAGDGGGVSVETNGCECAALAVVTPDEFFRQVHRIGSAATVAENDYFAACGNSLGDQPTGR